MTIVEALKELDVLSDLAVTDRTVVVATLRTLRREVLPDIAVKQNTEQWTRVLRAIEDHFAKLRVERDELREKVQRYEDELANLREALALEMDNELDES